MTPSGSVIGGDVFVRIQLDGLELFLPIGRRGLQRDVTGRFGGGLFIEHRLDGCALLLVGISDGDVVGKIFAVLHGVGIPRALSLKPAGDRTFCAPDVLGIRCCGPTGI